MCVEIENVFQRKSNVFDGKHKMPYQYKNIVFAHLTKKYRVLCDFF